MEWDTIPNSVLIAGDSVSDRDNQANQAEVDRVYARLLDEEEKIVISRSIQHDLLRVYVVGREYKTKDHISCKALLDQGIGYQENDFGALTLHQMNSLLFHLRKLLDFGTFFEAGTLEPCLYTWLISSQSEILENLSFLAKSCALRSTTCLERILSLCFSEYPTPSSLLHIFAVCNSDEVFILLDALAEKLQISNAILASGLAFLSNLVSYKPAFSPSILDHKLFPFVWNLVHTDGEGPTVKFQAVHVLLATLRSESLGDQCDSLVETGLTALLQVMGWTVTEKNMNKWKKDREVEAELVNTLDEAQIAKLERELFFCLYAAAPRTVITFFSNQQNVPNEYVQMRLDQLFSSVLFHPAILGDSVLPSAKRTWCPEELYVHEQNSKQSNERESISNSDSSGHLQDIMHAMEKINEGAPVNQNDLIREILSLRALVTYEQQCKKSLQATLQSYKQQNSFSLPKVKDVSIVEPRMTPQKTKLMSNVQDVLTVTKAKLNDVCSLNERLVQQIASLEEELQPLKIEVGNLKSECEGHLAQLRESELKQKNLQKRIFAQSEFEKRVEAITKQLVVLDKNSPTRKTIDLGLRQATNMVKEMDIQSELREQDLAEALEAIAYKETELRAAESKEAHLESVVAELETSLRNQRELLDLAQRTATAQVRSVESKYNSAKKINISLERQLRMLTSEVEKLRLEPSQ
eukprot:m.88598 g.88598  ORF g.88598 m.88598 type:complete len:695 (+) comp13176_c0_seq1:172-2256(+)